MVWANRAHTVETPKQPSPGLRLRASHFYPDPKRLNGNFSRAHAETSPQPQAAPKEHREIRKGRKHLVVQPGDNRKRPLVLTRDNSDGDPGEKLAHQGRLSEAHGNLPGEPGNEQQIESYSCASGEVASEGHISFLQTAHSTVTGSIPVVWFSVIATSGLWLCRLVQVKQDCREPD